MPYLTRRILTPEKMDEPDVAADKLKSSFRFIRWVNRRLGGSKAIIRHLSRWSRTWKKDQTIRILDIATGCADIPLAIAAWAKQAGFNVHITGVDRHATTLALAAEHIAAAPEPPSNIQLIAGDALKLPFPPNSFDYCITSMFLHHLTDIEVLTVLRIMDRLATRGIIWNDLSRSHLGYWSARLVTLPLNDIVRFDGPVSVLAGFKKHEVLDIRARLSLDYTQYHRHFWHRFTLAGQK
jgi:2-polyprenyl-3-methyl-5-hydroxy-6-metoxy-1,4-benzoquinol methylase